MLSLYLLFHKCQDKVPSAFYSQSQLRPFPVHLPEDRSPFPIVDVYKRQTLQSAMNSSVNWYFQSVDEQLGASNIYSYIQEPCYSFVVFTNRAVGECYLYHNYYV